MSTNYTSDYLLNNTPSSKNTTTSDDVLVEGVKELYKKLRQKQLVVDMEFGDVFFSNPYELFAAVVKGDSRKCNEVKYEMIECITEVSDWKAFMPELEFLQANKLVLSQFLRNPDSPIFWGLVLILLSALYKYQLKLYQLYEGKSLITCDIGSPKEGYKALRVAIVIFPNGFKFSLLKKAQPSDKSPVAFETHLQGLHFENKIFEIRLTKNELNALKVLTENLGFFPQLIVDYGDLLSQKEYYCSSKTELSQIFDNIVKITTSTDFNSKENATRLMRIENLGIENLNSRLKAELIFGAKVIYNPFQRIKENEFNKNFSANKPPGLKDRYLDGSMVLQNLDQQTDRNEQKDKSVPNVPTVNPLESPTRKAEDSEGVQKEPKSFKDIAAVKPVILDQNKLVRYMGKLKFVNEKSKYGFLVKEADGSDVFFHLSDMENAGISADMLLKNKDLRFSFAELKYIGKHNISKKAVEIKLHQE